MAFPVEASYYLSKIKVSGAPALIIGALTIIIFLVYRSFTDPVLPNVPFLKISDRPGTAGNNDDVKAFLLDSFHVMMKGYKEYNKKGIHFLLRTPQQVYLMVAPTLIEEIRKASPNHLSHKGAGNIIFQTRHTLHPALEHDQTHFDVVVRAITPALNTQLTDLVVEAKIVFSEHIGIAEDWTTVNMSRASFRMVCQVTNRLLATKELCRNPEFLKWSASYTRSIFGGAVLVRNYPKFLRTLIMRWKTDVVEQKATARRFLMPIIQERIQKEALYSVQGKPEEWEKIKEKDAIQWLIDATPVAKRDLEILLFKAMHLNVTGVHAPCVTWIELVFDLCRHPEIHDELRDELAEVLAGLGSGGWNKNVLNKLVKMDSFIRESARMTPLSAVKLERLAVSDYTLSDGTFVPKGTSIAVVAQGVQLDTDLLPGADKFDAFRFAKLREQSGQENNWQFSQTSETNLLFGHGKYACPGRHFASAVEKIMLALTLIIYDIRFVPGQSASFGHWTQKFRNPDFTASVQWKRRDVDSRFKHI